jgi:hypothetical protein
MRVFVGFLLGFGSVYAAQEGWRFYKGAGRFMCDQVAHEGVVPCARCEAERGYVRVFGRKISVN